MTLVDAGLGWPETEALRRHNVITIDDLRAWIAANPDWRGLVGRVLADGIGRFAESNP